MNGTIQSAIAMVKDGKSGKVKLANLPLITVDRCARPACFYLKIAELHNFTDALQIAYGAVKNFRLVDVKEKIHCAFLIGRYRLVPLRPMTVPRLELSAAVLAVQLDRTVREELDIPINQSTFWSDSTSVLQYIRIQSKRFRTFVAKRLSVIHENSATHQWRHVSSELNPADKVTRGLTVDEMSASSKWLSGPEFLKKKEEFWPCDPTIHRPELSDDDLEVKREVQLYNQSSTCHASKEVLFRLIERYSARERLRRAVAWLLRFRTCSLEVTVPVPLTLELRAVCKCDLSCPWKKLNTQKGKLSGTYKGCSFQTSLKQCKESVHPSLHAK